MPLTASNFNRYMFFKLPSAWWCGVRLRSLDPGEAMTAVRLRWINQNPFQSMFWAVQGMAAEFASGALVTYHIRESGRKFSMLVLNNRANFTKKATGRIQFTCQDGAQIREAVQQALATGEGTTIWTRSTGVNSDGVVVSTFEFEWTLKAKA